MDDKELLDVYSDYLISAFGQTTSTGLSELLGGTISHDRIQRFLAQNEFTSGDLWQMVKPHGRAIQQPEGGLIIDDRIAEKPYTDENEIVCWHYDHAHDRQVKGINFLSALYPVQAIWLPVGFRLVAKTEYYIDKKDGQTKRRSPISKNEHYQALLRQAKQNQISFRFVLNDVWSASADNMRFVKHQLASDFIMPLKANRKLALSRADKQQGRYVPMDSLTLEAGVVREIYLEGVDFPLALVKQVFANEAGSSGIH
jgi:DDE superfamily endonuclease